MRVTMYSGPAPFLDRAEPFLKSDPFSTNVIAVVATRIALGVSPINGDYLWMSIEGDHSRIIGVAMHTPPNHMFLSRMPEDAARVLAEQMAGRGRDLPGVNGAVESTRAFAGAWKSMTGHSSTVLTKMRMYQLDELVWPQAAQGQAGRAEISRDLSVVTEWFTAFHGEAQPEAPVDDWSAVARRRIDAGEVHLWQAKDVPVALAGVTGAVQGVARVGPVYTPQRCRKHGYGSAVTAAATSAALRGGAQHVVLYTDLANPTSNSIYQTLGYRHDHDAEERTFR